LPAAQAAPRTSAAVCCDGAMTGIQAAGLTRIRNAREGERRRARNHAPAVAGTRGCRIPAGAGTRRFRLPPNLVLTLRRVLSRDEPRAAAQIETAVPHPHAFGKVPAVTKLRRRLPPVRRRQTARRRPARRRTRPPPAVSPRPIRCCGATAGVTAAPPPLLQARHLRRPLQTAAVRLRAAGRCH